jgi:hypothetical protein
LIVALSDLKWPLRMYDEFTLRDDYGELLIVSSDRDVKKSKT